VASARPHFRVSVGTSLEDANFVLHMIAKQIPYRYPNIKFMNDRLRRYPAVAQNLEGRNPPKAAIQPLVHLRHPTCRRVGRIF
jgi:hypothetical protein